MEYTWRRQELNSFWTVVVTREKRLVFDDYNIVNFGFMDICAHCALFPKIFKFKVNRGTSFGLEKNPG
jgi:hypothetical protein